MDSVLHECGWALTKNIISMKIRILSFKTGVCRYMDMTEHTAVNLLSFASLFPLFKWAARENIRHSKRHIGDFVYIRKWPKRLLFPSY
jgi:hypothetical protein